MSYILNTKWQKTQTSQRVPKTSKSQEWACLSALLVTHLTLILPSSPGGTTKNKQNLLEKNSDVCFFNNFHTSSLLYHTDKNKKRRVLVFHRNDNLELFGRKCNLKHIHMQHFNTYLV